MFSIDDSTGVIKTGDNLKEGGYNVSLTAQVSDKGNNINYILFYKASPLFVQVNG